MTGFHWCGRLVAFSARAPRIKKFIFSAPRTCPIDLFGPLANRTVLKRLHAAIRFCWLVSYRPLARLRRESTHSLQSRSPAIAAVNRRHRFDRAVTHLLARGAPGAYSAYRHQLCCKAAKLQLGPRLLKQVRWNKKHPLRTCSHCTKSCGNRGHTYTPHSRRALREARNRRAQHAGRRTTTRKRPSVHETTQRGA